MHVEYCKLETVIGTDTTKNIMFCLVYWFSSPGNCIVYRNSKIKVCYFIANNSCK